MLFFILFTSDVYKLLRVGKFDVVDDIIHTNVDVDVINNLRDDINTTLLMYACVL